MAVGRKVRPVGLLILTIFIFCLAAWNGFRLGETIFFWKTLAQYGAHPLYIAITGATWLIVGLFLVWSLWLGKSWGWVATLASLIGYTAWYWVDLLVLQGSHANWPFILIVNIVFLLLILLLLFWNKTKRFFQ